MIRFACPWYVRDTVISMCKPCTMLLKRHFTFLSVPSPRTLECVLPLMGCSRGDSLVSGALEPRVVSGHLDTQCEQHSSSPSSCVGVRLRAAAGDQVGGDGAWGTLLPPDGVAAEPRELASGV